MVFTQQGWKDAGKENDLRKGLKEQIMGEKRAQKQRVKALHSKRVSKGI